jgi:uncharacterized coiled-coil protein SlyX
MATSAQLSERIEALETRIAIFAGVSATSLGDQSTSFDLDGAQKELARLRNELALVTASSGTRTRYAAYDKGL